MIRAHVAKLQTILCPLQTGQLLQTSQGKSKSMYITSSSHSPDNMLMLGLSERHANDKIGTLNANRKTILPRHSLCFGVPNTKIDSY